MTLRTTLQDAVLEKELRYRDPLQYIDQPDVYINSLQLALVQLNLVQKVLKVDYKAAMKDFRASRREVKPTMKDIVASREEIKENQLRLATVRSFNIVADIILSLTFGCVPQNICSSTPIRRNSCRSRSSGSLQDVLFPLNMTIP